MYGDGIQRHLLTEQRVDLRAPCVVKLVAELMSQTDVVRGEVPSMLLKPWVVVGRRRPGGWGGGRGRGRPRVEVPTTPVAVALGHLAANVDDLAVLGKLPEDAANSER